MYKQRLCLLYYLKSTGQKKSFGTQSLSTAEPIVKECPSILEDIFVEKPALILTCTDLCWFATDEICLSMPKYFKDLHEAVREWE